MTLFMWISVLLFSSYLCFQHYVGSNVEPSHYRRGGQVCFLFLIFFLCYCLSDWLSDHLQTCIGTTLTLHNIKLYIVISKLYIGTHCLILFAYQLLINLLWFCFLQDLWSRALFQKSTIVVHGLPFMGALTRSKGIRIRNPQLRFGIRIRQNRPRQ
jgi:hypothetical protein